MKIPAIATLLVSLLVLLGCIYIPPVWDINDAINNIDWIKPGVTTKEQVVKRLGEPYIIYWGEGSDGDIVYGERIIYRGKSSDGFIGWGMGGTGRAGLIEEEAWSIDIEFDAAGVVQKLTKSGAKSP